MINNRDESAVKPHGIVGMPSNICVDAQHAPKILNSIQRRGVNLLSALCFLQCRFSMQYLHIRNFPARSTITGGHGSSTGSMDAEHDVSVALSLGEP